MLDWTLNVEQVEGTFNLSSAGWLRVICTYTRQYMLRIGIFQLRISIVFDATFKTRDPNERWLCMMRSRSLGRCSMIFALGPPLRWTTSIIQYSNSLTSFSSESLTMNVRMIYDRIRWSFMRGKSESTVCCNQSKVENEMIVNDFEQFSSEFIRSAHFYRFTFSSLCFVITLASQNFCCLRTFQQHIMHINFCLAFYIHKYNVHNL